MVLSSGIFFFKAYPVINEIAFLEEKKKKEGKWAHYHELLSLVGFVALADHDSPQPLLNKHYSFGVTCSSVHRPTAFPGNIG